MPLQRQPNCHQAGGQPLRDCTPGGDFYQLLIDTHRDLSDEQSALVNAKLILLLSNHIGDLAVAIPEVAQPPDLLVGDGARLTADLESELDDRRDGWIAGLALMGEFDVLLRDAERSGCCNMGFQAEATPLLRLHGNRDQLAGLAGELGPAHGLAQL